MISFKNYGTSSFTLDYNTQKSLTAFKIECNPASQEKIRNYSLFKEAETCLNMLLTAYCK